MGTEASKSALEVLRVIERTVTAIEKAEEMNTSAFCIAQQDIDEVLLYGPGISGGESIPPCPILHFG
jgi:hypothetical protein